MPWKPKFTDEELSEHIVNIQKKHPLHTIANVCVELGVSRNYITVRAKDSELVSCAKKTADEIREKAWIQRGIDNMGDKELNATMYIWMTRNILGWTDKLPVGNNAEVTKDGKLIIDLSGDSSKKKE